MNESDENRIYRDLVERQMAAGGGEFCPFRKERQMERLFARLAGDFKAPGRKVLDMCGGYGRLTHFMNEFDPRHEYHCVDASKSLIAKAHASFAAHRNIHCEVADLYALPPGYDKAFDVTILYKTLYCLPYYAQALEQLVRVSRNRIYVTSPFFEGDIDFISRIYPNASKGDESAYHYSNSYGIPRFSRYCRSLGVKDVQFEDLRLDFDLEPPASKDVLQTHTVQTRDQGRMEITGVLVLDWKLAILTL